MEARRMDSYEKAYQEAKLAKELVDSCSESLANGLTPKRVYEILIHVADTVDAAHKKGVE